MRRIWTIGGLPLMLAGATAAYLGLTQTPFAQTTQEPGLTRYRTQTTEIEPDDEARLLSTPAPRLSARQRDELLRRKEEIREQMKRQMNNQPPSPPGLPLVRGRETQLVTPEGASPEIFGGVEPDLEVLSHTPNALVTGRNVKNTAASGSAGHPLAEVSAVGEGQRVFYTGNTHAEYSTSGGSSWTNVAIPGGPTDAPLACCDLDVVYDKGRGLTIWSVLYSNGMLTNGVVRLFVRRDISSSNSCTYTVDPAGSSDNILPDYPHLAVSNGFLYLATNNLRTTPTRTWAGAQVRRFKLDQMLDCSSLTTETFTFNGTQGQRVFSPVEGAREVMYWGMLENTTTFRIFKWPESTSTVSSVTRSISAATLTRPVCRGGTNNADWFDGAVSIVGFDMRGAVGRGRVTFLWNVGADGAHSQGHVHAAQFDEPNLNLVSQPHIYNSSYCVGYPNVTVNERGDLGLSIAAGGRSTRAGPAVKGYIGIEDDFTTGTSFSSLVETAGGTHNPPDGRYGDYFSIRRHEPCSLWFVATNYALSGGVAATNVNARYVEYGRGRDKVCYDLWSKVSR